MGCRWGEGDPDRASIGGHSRVKEAGGHAVNELYNVSMSYRPGRVVDHQLVSRKTVLSGRHPAPTISSMGCGLRSPGRHLGVRSPICGFLYNQGTCVSFNVSQPEVTLLTAKCDAICHCHTCL